MYKRQANEPVHLLMSCESEGDAPGSCSHSIDLAPTLNQFEIGKWNTLNIELTCFSEYGVDFAGLVAPFVLTTEQAYEIEVSAIQFSPANDKATTIRCN